MILLVLYPDRYTYMSVVFVNLWGQNFKKKKTFCQEAQLPVPLVYHENEDKANYRSYYELEGTTNCLLHEEGPEPLSFSLSFVISICANLFRVTDASSST